MAEIKPAEISAILKKQVERFGNHIFKNGSVVTGGTTYLQDATYLKLDSTYAGTAVTANNFIGAAIVDSVSAPTKRAEVIKVFDADAVIFSVGVTGMKKIVSSSPSLQNRPEFRNLNNLGAVDVLATRLWFDRKIDIPRPSNACFGFDDSTGWTFFDLNALHDEFKNEPGTVIEADFYHANQFLHLSDEEIVQIVQGYLTKCIPGFREAKVIDSSVIRLANAVTHFAPGSYRYLLPAKTSLQNLFMSGDWIINRHGSWSQEKAYVTGLEAANLAISYLETGEKANILAVEADENHIQFARNINQVVRDVGKSILPNFWLP
jgi:uncharacterized protein with NAD-binding domain and iron-sulfur cluster